MNNSLPSVSVIVPARDEAGTIKKIIYELPDLGSKTEIIFIESRSRDNTLGEIQKVANSYKGPKEIKWISLDCDGKADAVRKGFEIANGDILITYDADMAVPPEEIDNFLHPLLNGKGKLINGTRFVYPMEKGAMHPLNYIVNKIYSLIMSWLSGQKITDTLCGTKALWRQDYKNIKKFRNYFGNYDPFGDYDLLLGAINSGFKIIEMPVHYKTRIYGGTKTKNLKHGWLLFKMLFSAARKIKFTQPYES